tara:strand:+ start:398 stop:703 length:306 start_codon:yes stop_codon:yes gene_type:complete
MPRKKKKIIDRPIVVGDYVKVKLSGLGSDAYVVEEIHYKENKDGIVLDADDKPIVSNYTVAYTEVGTNGTYTHRIGQNGTMFVTGKQGYSMYNLKSRLQLV